MGSRHVAAPRHIHPLMSVEVLPFEPPFGPQVMDELGLRGIHSGSGPSFREGWLNTDVLCFWDYEDHTTELSRLARLARTPQETIYYLQHDSSEPYPCPDGLFDWGFSEHLIEHLTVEEAVAFLTEMRRVVKSGGLLRLSTPDLEAYVRGYLEPDGNFFAEHRKRLIEMRVLPEDPPQRRAWMVNQIFVRWEHRWIYDLDEIKYVAALAGFSPDQVVRCGYREGSLPEVADLDLPVRNDESLYVELRAPQASAGLADRSA
jgi:SAM-dependent methyltransferase